MKLLKSLKNMNEPSTDGGGIHTCANIAGALSELLRSGDAASQKSVEQLQPRKILRLRLRLRRYCSTVWIVGI